MNPSKSYKKIILILLPILIVMMIFIIVLSASSKPKAEADSNTTDDKNDKQTTIDVLGVIKAKKIEEVSFKTEVKIKKIYTSIGEMVEKGNNLILLDTGKNIQSSFNNGIVSKLSVTEGSIITPSTQIIEIIDFDSIYIEADVPEDQIKYVKLGASAKIVPVADTSKEFKGEVKSISNIAVLENGETKVKVDIRLDNETVTKQKYDYLKPNYNVDVSINKELSTNSSKSSSTTTSNKKEYIDYHKLMEDYKLAYIKAINEKDKSDLSKFIVKESEYDKYVSAKINDLKDVKLKLKSIDITKTEKSGDMLYIYTTEKIGTKTKDSTDFKYAEYKVRYVIKKSGELYMFEAAENV
jgi:hypothetical protein